MKRLLLPLLLIAISSITTFADLSYEYKIVRYPNGNFGETWTVTDENGNFWWWYELRSPTGALIRGQECIGHGSTCLYWSEWSGNNKRGGIEPYINFDTRFINNKGGKQIDINVDIDKVRIVICSIGGQILLDEINQGNKTIKLDNIPNGVYLVSCIYKDQIYTKKIMIGD